MSGHAVGWAATATGSVRYPLAPLLERILATSDPEGTGGNDKGLTRLAMMTGYSRSTVMRWARAGLTWASADEAAVRAGYHPSEVWPEWADTLPG